MNLKRPSGDINDEQPADQEDRQLLQAVARGDEVAFRALYERYQGPLFNYLLRLMREPAGAEDLLQEIFVAAWQGAGRFRGEAQVKTWLFRIAHNQAVSWLRRLRPVESLPPELEGERESWQPEEQSVQNWRAGQVWLALEKLSPAHRAVVELTYVHGFSYADIAEILDCPVGTVKSRMSYALRHLYGLLRALDVE